MPGFMRRKTLSGIAAANSFSSFTNDLGFTALIVWYADEYQTPPGQNLSILHRTAFPDSGHSISIGEAIIGQRIFQ
jgi:hypothetical protein